MVLIAVAADKGAPGVSTSVVALGLGWPRPVLLAECDPAGADLPWRLQGQDGQPLSQSVGIASLATAARSSGGLSPLRGHLQVLDGGLDVLVGPAGPEQAEAIGSSWASVAACLGAVADVDVLADCGRVLTTSTLVAPVLQQADLVVMVTRPTLGGVAHLRRGIARVARLLNTTTTRDGGPRGSGLDRIGVLVVDDGATGRRAGARQVDEVMQSTPGLVDVPVLGILAYDAKAAAALAGSGWGARLGRSALLRTAEAVAVAVVGRADARAGDRAGPSPAPRQGPGPASDPPDPGATHQGSGRSQ